MGFTNDNMNTFDSFIKLPGQGWQGLQPEFTDMAVSLWCSYCVSAGQMDALWMGSAQLKSWVWKNEKCTKALDTSTPLKLLDINESR